MLVSFFIAAAMFVQMQAWAVTDDTSAFHASARSAIASIPVRFNDWEGTEIKVPAPAAKLLRPNGEPFARRYESSTTGRVASVVLIHCTDSRDMSGHYPPNCYPASGWTAEADRRESEIAVGRRQIPFAIYQFSRTELGSTRHTIVYNVFVLPTGFVTRMEQVQSASGDRRSRPYGAAQVQVILDGATPELVQQQIVSELLLPLVPVIDLLQVRKQGDRS